MGHAVIGPQIKNVKLMDRREKMFISETSANLPTTVYPFQPPFDNPVNPKAEVT